MIAIDTNILIYAHRKDTPWHKKADQFLTEVAESGIGWSIPYTCLHEFYAKVTHPKIFNPPSSIKEAILQIEAWLEAPSLQLIGEREDYFKDLKKVLETAQLTGAHIHDIRIACICFQNGVSELFSADRDFNRIKGLKVKNPLL